MNWGPTLFSSEIVPYLIRLYFVVPISIKDFLMFFQPARPFLLHKSKQGGHPYLVPCSLNSETRVFGLARQFWN